MSPIQVIEVVKKYAQVLDTLGACPVRNIQALDIADKRNHLRWMCDEIERMLLGVDLSVKESEQKASRWLGFIQGALMVMDIATIEEMKNDNRSR